jgi:NAD(P)-dependent dehydrogenase (short-subunit alcohol dehydrogenase family)
MKIGSPQVEVRFSSAFTSSSHLLQHLEAFHQILHGLVSHHSSIVSSIFGQFSTTNAMATGIFTQFHLDPYEALNAEKLQGHFQGKSVLVTGGGYGIGKEVAKSFAIAGAKSVLISGRTEGTLKATAEELGKEYPKVKFSFLTVDLEAPKTIATFFNSLTESPDILINNAGFLSKPAAFMDADMDEWWRSFTINVLGTAVMTQSYLRHRKSLNVSEPAVIITLNTLGAFGFRAPKVSAYAASKAAAARLNEQMAVDVPESVARFISVHPGAVKTAMYDKSELLIPPTDIKLTADFIVWVTTEQADFLASRFVYVNWDIDELLTKKDEILEKDLLRTHLSGM